MNNFLLFLAHKTTTKMIFQKKYHLIFFWLLFSVSMLYGQSINPLQQQKDSIFKHIKQLASAKEKLDAHKKAFQYFVRKSPDIAQEFAEKGLHLAQKEKATKQQIGFSNNLGLTFIIQRKYDQALSVFNAGLSTAKKAALLEDYLLIKHRIASVWLKQGHKKRAAQLLDSIITVAKEEKLVKAEGMAATEMGKLERINGNYDKSLGYFKRNLEIAQQLNSKGQMAYSYLQIAIDYDKTGEQKKAIAINKKGIALAQETHNEVRLVNFYNNIAINYRNLKNYDSAYSYQHKVLEKHKTRKNPFEIARSYMNIGTTYSFQKRYDKALAYYDSAYTLVKDKKGHALLGSIAQNMGALYQDMKEYRKANQYNYQALALATSRKQTNEYFNIYENIYQSYKGVKKWDSALYYHEKMLAIKDSLFSKEKTTNTERIKREIETIENQKTIADLTFDKRQNKILFISALGAFLSAVLIAFLWIKNTNRKKLIAEQNQSIEEQKVLTLIQEQELQVVDAMIKGQDQERQKIAEELHDGLGSSLATLKLHTENLLINPKISENSKTKLISKIDQIIDETYKKVRNISHVKSNTTVEQKGLVAALEKLAGQINTDSSTQVHIDIFGFEKLAKNELKIFIYNSIQELLTNAIKHAHADEINIQITQHENELNILIEDNGNGFIVNEKIFEKGIGLYQIRKKVLLMGGRFIIDSAPQKGTTININIPV